MINSQTLPLPKALTPVYKAARNLAFSCLQRLQHGSLTVIESFESRSDEDSTTRFGDLIDGKHMR